MPNQCDGTVGGGVSVGFSEESDTAVALRQLLDELRADSAALTLIFYGPQHDASVVAEILYECVGERGIGGSTAGELSRAGFTHGAMTGMSFHGAARAALSVMQNLSTASLLPISSLPRDLAQQIGAGDQELDPNRHVWLLLLDGISGREDLVAPFLGRHLRGAGLVGGSLADEKAFKEVTMVFGGSVYRDAGALILLEYDRPFELIQHSQFEFTEHSFEVTAVSESGRILQELDGRPVLDVYSDVLGIPVDELDQITVSLHPLGYRFRGKPFSCSVLQLRDDGFWMAYSLQRGQQLTVLRPVNQVPGTRVAVSEAAERLQARGGDPQAMLIFHCLGRFIEAEQIGVLDELFDALNQVPLCGLNTYGEQFAGMHLNHAITGVMFG